MEVVALVLLVLLFAGIAAIVQNPFLIGGFALGAWLLNKGFTTKT